jgi:hypothetical protein
MPLIDPNTELPLANDPIVSSEPEVTERIVEEVYQPVSKKDVAPEDSKEAVELRRNAPAPLPLKAEGYERLEFCPTALRFLTFFSSDVKRLYAAGKSLHKWQVETLEDISLGITRDYKTGEELKRKVATSVDPYSYALCAANGSGKDNFVIAPLALWFVCTKIKAKVIITSSSAEQLNTQTEKYIRELANDVNQWALANFGQEILRVVQRRIVCHLTGSVINLFVTDEPAKAEGHHPLAADTEMLIIVNEAKSIRPDIYEALNRCTGYSHWIDVSSPGQPMGDFHFHFQHWENKRRVSYFDCPHHAPAKFEEDRIKYGEHSAYFRSKWLALFTFTGGKYVVSHQRIQELLQRQREGQIKPIFQDGPIRIGIDLSLSGNGDETVISVWKGNTQLDQKSLHQQDATILAYQISEFLTRHVKKDHQYIFADDGGVGRAIIDILNRGGWRIKRVLNNATTNNKKQYKNKGAQLWYKFGRFIEAGILIFKDPNDAKLFTQIASRKYKDSTGGTDILQLESKKDMISAGMDSPDRADAAVLAFTDVPLEQYLAGAEKADIDEVPQRSKEDIIRELKHNLKYNKHLVFGRGEAGKQRHSHFSVNTIMKNQRSDNIYGR